jgi:ABC-type antimicrobial peptide transport system permease subunit
MAAKYWPRSNPLGRIFHLKGRAVQVVGVSKMSKYGSLLESSKPFFYVALRQNPAGVVILHIRTSLAPGSMASALSREIHSLDPGLAAGEVLTMRQQVDRKSGAQTVALTLVGIFCGLALVLATIGLYGVMSYAVSQSARELGLRMALGAAASDLLRLVMRHGLVLTAAGVLLGAAAALGSTRLLGDLLYKVSPHDPMVFGCAFVVMAAAALAACFLPAWRASRIDPVRALRDR